MPVDRDGFYPVWPLWWDEYEYHYHLFVPAKLEFSYYCDFSCVAALIIHVVWLPWQSLNTPSWLLSSFHFMQPRGRHRIILYGHCV